MNQLIECVPNVSEGRDQNIIQQLKDAIKSVENVKLLHVDSGEAANRTVFTFVGQTADVEKAALNLYKKCDELIDMRTQIGEHPRQGAVDVCPFIPLSGISMEETIDFSINFAKKLVNELNIPIYLYEESTKEENRKNLAYLRKGEYEALPSKFSHTPPDFGNPENWKKSGVTTIGARKLLVAYNINLNTTDVSIAKKVAEEVRESGKVITDHYGKRERIPGRFKSVKGLGWYIEDFNKVQVSYNLTDIEQAGMLDVFLATKEEVEKLNYEVTGSELVGLAPLSEFVKAGSYFKAGIPCNEKELIKSTIQCLGLDELKDFEPNRKIIEHLI